MFTKAPRFQPEKPSIAPGPGAYNPKDVTSEAYSRGGFLERTERFRETKVDPVPAAPLQTSSTYGGNSQAAPLTTSATADKRVKRTASEVLSKKENEGLIERNSKLEIKLAKTQDRLAEAVKDRSRMESEADVLKREFRHREAAFRSQLEQSEVTIKKLSKKSVKEDSLEARLEELRTMHKESKAKRDVEIDRLRSELANTDRTAAALAQAQQDLTAARTSHTDALASRDRELALVREELAMVVARTAESQIDSERRWVVKEVAWQEERALLSRAGETSGNEKTTLEEALKGSKAALEEMTALVESLQLEDSSKKGRESSLRSRVDQLEEVVKDVSELYTQLHASSVPAAVHQRAVAELADARWQLDRLGAAVAEKDGSLQVLAEEASDMAFVFEGLRALLKNTEESENASRELLQTLIGVDSLPSPPPEPLVTPSDVDLFNIPSKAELSVQLCISSLLLSHSVYLLSAADHARAGVIADRSAALDEANAASQAQLAAESALATLQQQLNLTSADLASLERDLASAREREFGFEKSKEELRALQEARDGWERSRATAATEWKRERKRLVGELAEEREKLKRLAHSAAQSQLANGALKAELELSQRELADARDYESAYLQKVEENEMLFGLNELAEEDARQIADFNSEIISQANPDQRIVYVTRVRAELVETKRELLSRTLALNRVSNDCENLRLELDAYRSSDLSSKPSTKLLRVSRQPPTSGGVGSLRASSASTRSHSSTSGQSQSLRPERDYISTPLMVGGSQGRGGGRVSPQADRDDGTKELSLEDLV